MATKNANSVVKMDVEAFKQQNLLQSHHNERPIGETASRRG
jgi:hypothetical protein